MSRIPTPDPQVIVVMGATGDLATQKLLPAIFHLHQDGLLPDRYRLIGVARTDMSDQQFREHVRGSLREYSRCDLTAEGWEELEQRVTYAGGEFGPGSTEVLATAVREAEEYLGEGTRRFFYLAVPPPAFVPITRGLGESGLTERARVVYEKPFGSDLGSARRLNQAVHEVFDEEQVYRIDHFLGKESVQNILAFRFANGMFEPIWNRTFVDHVQIDVPEAIGIGERAGFYEQTGALRDMVVTHLFQVLSFVAMEPPSSFDPEALVTEKIKVFKCIVPIQPGDVVRGQYDGYRDEGGVKPDSDTETFVAIRLFVDNWRWAGTPFFLRTGKRMAEKRTSVTIAFSDPPRQLFQNIEAERLHPDHLTLELGPREGVSLSFLAKMPGYDIRLGRAKMEFQYEGSFGAPFIQAYERLLFDALVGDPTLFTDAQGVEEAWEAVQPVLDDPPALHPYPPGSWGPGATDRLISPRQWHLGS